MEGTLGKPTLGFTEQIKARFGELSKTRVLQDKTKIKATTGKEVYTQKIISLEGKYKVTGGKQTTTIQTLETLRLDPAKKLVGATVVSPKYVVQAEVELGRSTAKLARKGADDLLFPGAYDVSSISK